MFRHHSLYSVLRFSENLRMICSSESRDSITLITACKNPKQRQEPDNNNVPINRTHWNLTRDCQGSLWRSVLKFQRNSQDQQLRFKWFHHDNSLQQLETTLAKLSDLNTQLQILTKINTVSLEILKTENSEGNLLIPKRVAVSAAIKTFNKIFFGFVASCNLGDQITWNRAADHCRFLSKSQNRNLQREPDNLEKVSSECD